MEKNLVKLPGVKFALLNKCGQEIACGVTDRCGELVFDCLPLGRYFIKELEAPCDFERSDKLVEVCIGCEHPHRAVEIINEKRKGSIKVLKFGACEYDEN